MSKSCACLTQVCACSGISNPANLPALTYRAAVYGPTKDRMLKLIAKQAFEYKDPDDPDGKTIIGTPPLAGLTTRTDSDPTIALIDSWAMACDVLCFYQERIANEGFLRTSTERRSILELARTIGYELAPGVAANVFLAVTVENSPLSPGVATMTVGTSVQHVPQKEEPPQTFEVKEETLVQASWNELLPQLHKRQDLVAGMDALLVTGTVTSVNRGDYLLLVLEDGNPMEVRCVREVSFDNAAGQTTISLENPPAAVPPAVPPALRAPAAQGPIVPGQGFSGFYGNNLTEGSLQANVSQLGINLNELQIVANAFHANLISSPYPRLPVELGDLEPGVYAFKHRTANFGHNAPPFDTLASVLKCTFEDEAGALVVGRFQGGTYEENAINLSYTENWPNNVDFYLERSFPDLRKGEPILIQDSKIPDPPEGEDPDPNPIRKYPDPWQIASSMEASVAEYTLSGKATGLVVQPLGTHTTDIGDYKLRNTTILAGASTLPLASLPVETLLGVGDTEITLERMVTGLEAGHRIILTGEVSDLPGVIRSESLVITDTLHADGLTTLILDSGLTSNYVRKTVKINANVVPATNGATVPSEILGSGDASKPNQAFALKKKPLTYTSSSNPTGPDTSMEVRVNGVKWTEVSDLYSSMPSDKVYIVRLADDGTVWVKFGDGVRGARLPSGDLNVVASYRQGIGVAGIVPAGTITLPKRKPLGVRSIVNPLDCEGGVDPESRDDARTNAPSTVLTMGRIVSRKDLEDYARRFAGVGKSSAIEIRDRDNRFLLLTVGTSLGQPFATESTTFKDLTASIGLAAEPDVAFKVLTYISRQFDVSAELVIDGAYKAGDVIAAAQSALAKRFTFVNRCFGEPASLAEVTATIQATPGVTRVDVNLLSYSDTLTGGEPPVYLEAQRAGLGSTGLVQAELLTINPFGITLTEATT